MRLRFLIVLLIVCLGLWLGLVGLEGALWWETPPYHLIEENLYLGQRVAAPPPGTRAVLNLCESEDTYHADVHRWQPIKDAAPAPDLDWLEEQVDFIDEQRRAGRMTYVHCMNGVSRSGLVVTAYLMREHGWPRDRALDFVRGKRPDVRPNVAFMRLLADWQQHLSAD